MADVQLEHQKEAEEALAATLQECRSITLEVLDIADQILGHPQTETVTPNAVSLRPLANDLRGDLRELRDRLGLIWARLGITI
jgi:hypothetical protein